MADDILKEVTGGIAHFFKEEKPELYVRPYVNVNKTITVQAARDFHDSNIVREHPKKILQTITKILCLQSNNSEKLTHVEATDIFFGVTKLFVSKDSALRRMVYVILKELYILCDPSDVIIVTSCLTRDMTSDVDVYRANALRVLVRIIDSAMLSAIERYVKQAIIHKSPLVANSALVSSLHLFQKSLENASIVKRWVGEVNEAMKSPNIMVQYHATQLFYQIKANDRLAVSKFVQRLSGVATNGSNTASTIKARMRSPLAIVCLIRYTSKLLHEEVMEGRAAPDGSIMDATELCSIGYRYLESCLRHETEMISFEAAKAICNLPIQAPEVVLPALSVLQLSLSSSKPTSRLATVKLLCDLASLHPNLVARFNEGLEALIGDSNRLIGTLSIMTLLKTGTESSMDRLLKSISNFLYHIAEEYKIMVVISLERLCLNYPTKFRVVVGFMSKFLREEGGFAFKKTIVNSIVSLMNKIPETQDIALLFLCEFIEDCEFVALSTDILNLIGNYGPKTSSPARYVRFIYNRCILENAMIRAAAVSALTQFAIFCPRLRASILPLLKSCQNDENDETRDRVTLAISVLEDSTTILYLNTDSAEKGMHLEPENDESTSGESSKQDIAVAALGTKLPMSFDNLAQRLHAYKAIPGAMESSELLCYSSLPIVEESSITPDIHMTASDITETMPGKINPVASQMSGELGPKLDQASVIYSIPELASFGRVFRSCKPLPLTEPESEYVVTCVKHILDRHIILQFIVQNTIEDQRLQNVSVSIHTDSTMFEIVGELPALSIRYGTTANCFTVLEKNEGATVNFTPTMFNSELKFSAISVDPETGEDDSDEVYEDDYHLEDFEIFIADFVAKTSVPDFRKAWESIGGANEMLQKFGLSEKTIANAAGAVVECMGMQPCDGTGTIKPGVKQHMFHLSGIFLGGIRILARCQIGISKEGTIVLKMAIRSERGDVSKIMLESIC